MRSLFSFSTTPYCTRGGSKLIQPKVNTNCFGINSSTYQGSKSGITFRKLQKILPTCLITCKDLIVKWEGLTCKSGFCSICNMSKILTPVFLRIVLLFYGAFHRRCIYVCVCVCFSDQATIFVCKIPVSCSFPLLDTPAYPHLYILILIFIVSPNSPGLMLFFVVGATKTKFLLSYLNLNPCKWYLQPYRGSIKDYCFVM